MYGDTFDLIQRYSNEQFALYCMADKHKLSKEKRARLFELKGMLPALWDRHRAEIVGNRFVEDVKIVHDEPAIAHVEVITIDLCKEEQVWKHFLVPALHTIADVLQTWRETRDDIAQGVYPFIAAYDRAGVYHSTDRGRLFGAGNERRKRGQRRVIAGMW